MQRVLRAAFGAGHAHRVRACGCVRRRRTLRRAQPATPQRDLDILLFSLAATPEVENHGAVLQLARDRWSRASAGSRLLVLVDEAPYLARLGGDASLAARIEQRRAAWRDFVRTHGFDACTLDLAVDPGRGDDGRSAGYRRPGAAQLPERVR